MSVRLGRVVVGPDAGVLTVGRAGVVVGVHEKVVGGVGRTRDTGGGGVVTAGSGLGGGGSLGPCAVAGEFVAPRLSVVAGGNVGGGADLTKGVISISLATSVMYAFHVGAAMVPP